MLQSKSPAFPAQACSLVEPYNHDYNQGYMARLTNTLELEKQATYFAASTGLQNAVNQAEATAWFVS